MANKISPSQANRLYNFVKKDLLSEEGSKLPDAYKNFYREWKCTMPQPVHYRPYESKYVKKEDTGEVKRIENVPLPLLFPPESHQGIWGGEGVIKGFQKRQPRKRRVPHFWVPNLFKSAVHSEILGKTMQVTVTERTIDLILKNKGFDNYILNTKACDLQSGLALKLKRKMLQRLFYKDLYPEDDDKREEVYNKYKHFLDGYTEEAIDWYGLTFDEALRKQRAIEVIQNKPVPLKTQFRKLLIEEVISKKLQEESNETKGMEDKGSSSIFSKLLSFTQGSK